jgi:hypothetical protein
MNEQPREFGPTDAQNIAIEMEDDLCRVHHLARAIFVMAEEEHKTTEYGADIVCLARMIMEKVDTFKDERRRAAGQSA